MFIAALGICNEPPTATEIVQLAIQCVLYDKDESTYADVVGSLLKAWGDLREKELEDDGAENVRIRWVKGNEAESLYRKHYCDVRGRDDDCWWPDALPFDAPLPNGFVIRIAKAIARKDVAEEEAFFEYCRQEEERKIQEQPIEVLKVVKD